MQTCQPSFILQNVDKQNVVLPCLFQCCEVSISPSDLNVYNEARS